MAALRSQLERHLLIAADLLDGEERARIERFVSESTGEIANLLRIVRSHPGTRLPLQDEIVSFGERLSSTLVAAVLDAGGVPARVVDARRCIRTTEEHTAAEPIPRLTRDATRAELLPLIEAG